MVSSSSMPSVVVTLCHPWSFHGKIKEVCLENMGRVWWGLKHICNTRECPSAVKDSDLQALERFVVLMLCTTVNKARLDHFARKTIWLDPTNSSSTQRACQTCFLWGLIRVGTSIEATSTNAKPIRLGMRGTGRGMESLLESTSSCWELTKCGCTKACTGRCKCLRYGLSCSCQCSCPC